MEKFEIKHTQGKWIIEDAYIYGQLQLHKHITIEGRFTNAPIATCYSEWLDKSEMMANLSLICAAPLLLSALIKFIQVSTGGDGSFHASPALLRDCYNDALAAVQAAISQPENVKP